MTAQPQIPPALNEYRTLAPGNRSGAQIFDTSHLLFSKWWWVTTLGLRRATKRENGFTPLIRAMREALPIRWTRIMALASSPPRKNGR